MQPTLDDLDYDDDNITYNGTDYDAEPCETNGIRNIDITIQMYINSLICVFGLLGNILVIITYAFYKKAKSMTDVYLLNVAIADLLFVVALPLIMYNEHWDWSMGNGACKILRATYSINLYSSMLLLACISGDRYIAIVQARRSFGARSRTLVYSRLICTSIWLFAFVLSIPTIIFTHRFEDKNLNGVVECNFNFDQSTDTASLVKVLVPSLQMSVGFCLPLLIMVFCYTGILVTLLKAQSFRRHKAVRVVMAVVIVFVVCHLPYNVSLLCHTIRLFKERSCEAEKAVLIAVAVTRCLAYLHCCLNPILYAFIGVNFRNHFREILVDLWCQGKKYIYSSRSSRQTSELYMQVSVKAPESLNKESQLSFTM